MDCKAALMEMMEDAGVAPFGPAQPPEWAGD